MTNKLFLLSVTIIALLGFINFTKAQNGKLYISDDQVTYDCPDSQVTAPANLNIDMDSVKIIDNRFFKDNNKIYMVSENWKARMCTFYSLDNIDHDSFEVLNNYYQKDKDNIFYSDNYWGFGTPQIINDADVNTFTVLNDWYAKDKSYAYYTRLTDHVKISTADVSTFEVLSEDANYAMDKNNMYLFGKILNEAADKITDNSLYQNLKGKIILKVEANGEAYYVHPNKQEMHYLSRPLVAFYVMREQGVGITDNDLEKIEIAMDNISGTDSDGDGLSDMIEDSLGTDKNNADSDGDGFNDKEEILNGYNPNNNNKINLDSTFAKNQAGKIFLQVEKNGEAWYVNPENNKRYFLGRPIDAFNVMRRLGLGISNTNFENMKKASEQPDDTDDALADFSVAEFEISLHVNQKLADELNYYYDKDTDCVSFSTNTFSQGDPNCSANDGPLGSLCKEDMTDNDGRKVVEFDNFSLYFFTPHEPCSFVGSEVNSELYDLAAKNAGGSYQLGTWNDTINKYDFIEISKN